MRPRDRGQDRIEWKMCTRGRRLQWGMGPLDECPSGYVRRLPSWGWEILSDDVILRAIEPGQSCALGWSRQGPPLAPPLPDQAMWSDLLGQLKDWYVSYTQHWCLIPSDWLPPDPDDSNFEGPRAWGSWLPPSYSKPYLYGPPMRLSLYGQFRS